MNTFEKPERKTLFSMSLAALGIVYGDIGTSPLYALKECFDAKHGIAYTPEALFGVISMMIPVVFLILPISILFALWPSLANLNLFAT